MGVRGRLAEGNGMKKGEAKGKQVEEDQGLASREEEKRKVGAYAGSRRVHLAV